MLHSQKTRRSPSGNYMVGQVCESHVSHPEKNSSSIGAVLFQNVIRQCGLLIDENGSGEILLYAILVLNTMT